MLLQAEGIDVNKGVRIMIHPLVTLLPLTPFVIGGICLSSFQLQGLNGTPLVTASKEGHTKIVAMLLQADGIDVNEGVSIMIPTPTISLSKFTSTSAYHYLCGMSVPSFFDISSFHLQYPLEKASKNGHTEIVAMLLQAKGIDVNYGYGVGIS